ncbi:CLUMA_CG010623, isoform A [Clunio marinus]|uniref:CLUMA_CG010623, isoform A n=1 Tax=Clunio marinus TaxID=568069 RepID=A0A1J1IAI6_9DIPT|nr:CLUMA_CG010623, isoform A [Clunio marinus]
MFKPPHHPTVLSAEAHLMRHILPFFPLTTNTEASFSNARGKTLSFKYAWLVSLTRKASYACVHVEFSQHFVGLMLSKT